MWSATFAAVLLLAGQVSAGVLGDVVHVIRRDEEMNRVARRFTEALIEGNVQKRQTTTFNTTAWDSLIQQACTTQLSALNGVASNPAGMAVCYNVPTLDTTTGSFYADLRLYMIAPSSGTFAGVPPQNIEVALAYISAAAMKINESSFQRRDVLSGISKRAAPVLIQSFALQGMLNMTNVTASTAPYVETIILRSPTNKFAEQSYRLF